MADIVADAAELVRASYVGISLITAERLRQIAVEGYDPEHDAGHTRGQLIEAASAYLLDARVTAMVEAGPSEMETAGVVYDAWYSISAYGHSSAGHDLPSLGVSFSSSFKPREPVTPEPADPPHGPGGC